MTRRGGRDEHAAMEKTYLERAGAAAEGPSCFPKKTNRLKEIKTVLINDDNDNDGQRYKKKCKPEHMNM
jgi:hypothetical protein